jgi:hypothetical protein
MNDSPATRSLRYDSVTDVTVLNERHALAGLVGEMLALERRLRIAITHYPINAETMPGGTRRVLARIDLMTDVHIEALEAAQDALGGGPGGPLAAAVTAIAGAGLTALAATHSPKLSKRLRDDYATLGLASIDYTLLRTVALGFGDGATANLAKRHRGDVLALMTEIDRLLPAVVVQELLDEGHTFTPEARRSALLESHDAWSDAGT